MAGYRNASTERLFRAILTLHSTEELGAFFEDLCTVREIQDMAQRLDTALLLDQGRNYREIVDEVGVSTATISRVNRCLKYGEGGYMRVIERMNGEKDAD